MKKETKKKSASAEKRELNNMVKANDVLAPLMRDFVTEKVIPAVAEYDLCPGCVTRAFILLSAKTVTIMVDSLVDSIIGGEKCRAK